jgi:hypothetical protein
MILPETLGTFFSFSCPGRQNQKVQWSAAPDAPRPDMHGLEQGKSIRFSELFLDFIFECVDLYLVDVPNPGDFPGTMRKGGYREKRYANCDKALPEVVIR